VKQTRTFEHAPESVTMARRFATEALPGAPAEMLETVGLMVSELASNCVRHTDSQFDLSIVLTAREIRVEATDHGGGEPCLRSPKPTDPTGRGLFIVDTLAEAWGVEHRDASGKTVWFAIAADTPAWRASALPRLASPQLGSRKAEH
jgi:anti-sigma regulatory factor (Ser/Thr protein kinase)